MNTQIHIGLEHKNAPRLVLFNRSATLLYVQWIWLITFMHAKIQLFSD